MPDIPVVLQYTSPLGIVKCNTIPIFGFVACSGPHLLGVEGGGFGL